MRGYWSFLKKEAVEGVRSGKLLFLGILFLVFGMMNPAIAKLTPWLLELLSDSLAESGMTVSAPVATAMTSWMQFFKNIPMALIAFLLTYAGSFVKEYESGTLVLILTKGLPRYKVVLAKATLMLTVWTLGYWLCFAVTCGYNSYFWSEAFTADLIPSCVYWWLFGIWTVCLTVLFSTLLRSYGGVAMGVGGCVLTTYLLGLLPKLSKIMPTALIATDAVLNCTEPVRQYAAAIVLTLIICVVGILGSIVALNKKQL